MTKDSATLKLKRMREIAAWIKRELDAHPKSLAVTFMASPDTWRLVRRALLYAAQGASELQSAADSKKGQTE